MHSYILCIVHDYIIYYMISHHYCYAVVFSSVFTFQHCVSTAYSVFEGKMSYLLFLNTVWGKKPHDR